VGGALCVACDGGDRIVVGSKNFTEQSILGELVAQQIERRTGVRVERRLYLGGTFVCHRAIQSGEIDIYVEYTGTAFTAILRREPIADADSVYRAVRAEYAERFDLTWGEPLGFDNTFAMIIRRADAERLGLRTISDAVPHARGWRAGFGPEFMERKDGYPGLRETYGLEFGAQPRIMDIGLMYRALAEGQVDMIAGNSTDGLIQALDLFVLEDDRDYFPPYEAAPVIRTEVLDRAQEVRAALDALAGRLSDGEMRHLNYLVDVERREPGAVVREWLDRELPLEPVTARVAVR
jgi:glycine betaine/choline ABC-type transport system substrate-binding protein